MVSTAVGLNKQGYIPYVSTFCRFCIPSPRSDPHGSVFENAHDHRRIICRDHDRDGRSIGYGVGRYCHHALNIKSTVVYPSDAVSAYKLTQSLVHHKEISYIRLTREKTPILYDEKEEFPIGGLKVHNLPISNNQYPISKQRTISKSQIKAVIIAAGITLHVALKAQKILAKKAY